MIPAVAAVAFGAGGAACAALFWRASISGARSAETTIGRLPFWSLLLAMLAALFAGALGNWTLAAAAGAATLVAALISALTDVRSGYVFDRALALAAVPVLGFAFAAGELPMRLIAALAIGALYAVPYVLSRGRGFGLGDVKLGVLLGAGIGLAGGLSAFVGSFVAGALFAIAGLSLGRLDRKATLPFAPFIAIGAAIGLAVPMRLPV